jgi:hypothetical protein
VLLLNANTNNNNEQESFKEAAGDKEISLYKLLDVIKKIDPTINIKDLISSKEILVKYIDNIEMLKNVIKEYHGDVSSMTIEMTIEQFLQTHPEIIDGEKLEAEIKSLSHLTLPATALTNLLKQFLNNPNRLESPRRNRITVEEHYLTKEAIITYKSEDAIYTLTVERIKELFAKRVQNGAKVFNFLLEKLNEQNYAENTEFMLSELIEAGIYANPDSAYRGLKTVLDKLMRIHIEGRVKTYEGRKRKEIGHVKTAIIGGRKVTYNKCVAILPSIIRDYTPYITILPRWGYALQSENAYMLLDYIYYLARQNTDKIRERGYFTINLDTIRQHLGIPSAEEVNEEHDGHYNQLIIKPIEDAITAIKEKQEGNELKITPVYDSNYKNVHEYLNGYLEIRMSGLSFEYMEQRAVQEEKRIAEAKRKALPPSKKTDKKEE